MLRLESGHANFYQGTMHGRVVWSRRHAHYAPVSAGWQEGDIIEVEDTFMSVSLTRDYIARS